MRTLPKLQMLARGLLLALAAPTLSAADRPNIIVIVADDMGYSDLGCYGSEIATPNLDALAADGLRFTQFYTTPKCFPSRASLLTGLYPHQTGLGRKPGKLQGGTTIAEVLRDAGYHTWMVGKWHGKDVPVTRGFEHFFGLVDGESNHFNPGVQRPGEPPPAADKGNRTWAIDDKVFKPWTPDDPNFYSSDAFMDRALGYVSAQHDEQPFFLYVAFTAPHYPIQARPEDIAKYRGKYLIGWDRVRADRYERQKEMGLLLPGMTLAPRGNTKFAVVRETSEWMNRFWDDNGQILPWEQVGDHDKWDLKMAVYAAMVDRMDQNVGRLRAKLRELGKEKNTIIFFFSDNGASSGTHHYGATPKDKPASGPGPMDSFHTYDTPWADVSNTPFYGYKDTCYEGGNATSFIVNWPDGLKARAGSITPEIAHVMDIMPTAIELAGATYPREFRGAPLPPLEGKSLVPLIRGAATRPGYDALFWEYNGDRAVRRSDWKLVAFAEGPWELYNLAKDRAETHNLATDQRAQTQELAQLWQQWGHRVGVDKLPPKKAKAGD